MPLPAVKRLTKEDLADAPPWIDRLLYPLNLFMTSVYGILSKSLTFDENFRAQIKDLSIVAASSASGNKVTIPLTMKAKPRWLILTATPTSATGDSSSPSFNWNYDGTNINITSISSLTSGVTYDVQILMV